MRHRTGKREPHGQPIINRHPGSKIISVADLFVKFHFEHDRVAWPHHLLETDVSNSCCDRDAFSVASVFRQEYSTGLHGRFAQEDARHQWKTGVVTGEPEFIAGKCLAARDPVLPLIDYFIE